MSLATIRAGLAARLETIEGLRTHAFDPDRISPPAAVVPPPEAIAYGRTMGNGLVEYDFEVKVLVSRADARSGQDRLCEYMEPTGANSVKAAIEGDRTAGLGCFLTDGVPAASDVHVSGVKEPGVYELGGVAYFGAVWSLTVYASGAAA